MTPFDIIQDSLVPDTVNVFFLGCFESRVTLYAQQVRALNLVDAILDQERVRPDGRVAIVGAGAAGVTAAAAFAVAEPALTVDLFDRQSQILHLQKSSDRYLHPHLYDWPAPGARRHQAGLPILDWSAGTASEVADTLQAQFTALKGPHVREKLGRAVQQVVPFPFGARVVVADAPLESETYDAVIISIGFGYERLRSEGFHSYWSPSHLVGTIRADVPPTIFVSGTGDGGLVDFQMAAFKGMYHRDVIEFLTGSKGLDQAESVLLEIEERAWAEEEETLDLFAEYEEHLPRCLPAKFWMDVLDRLRPRSRVWLHARGTRLFRRDTAVLNRFGAFVAITADRHAGAGRIHVCTGVDLGDPPPLSGPIRLDGAEPIDPLYRLLRFGADKEANHQPFLPLVEAFQNVRPPRAPGFRAATPSLTASARERFQRPPQPAPARPHPVDVPPAAPWPALPSAEAEPAADASRFDLRHADRALETSLTTYTRGDEVYRLLSTALAAAKRRKGVMLLGPSGAGKSVLMAQAFVQVRKRALFFAMDYPPAPEYEPAVPERQAPAPVEGGETRVLAGADEATSSRPREDAPDGEVLRSSGASAAATLAVPVRMHWLACACRLANAPQPRAPLSAREATGQICGILRRLADPQDPVYVFIDAVNQAETPEALLSGLAPERLPAGVVVIVSTHEDEEVMRRLRAENGGRYDWTPLNMQPTRSETVAMMLQGWPANLPRPYLDPELTRCLEQRVTGLAINAWGWGVRLQQLMREDGTVAMARFRAEVEEARDGAFPDEYLARLVAQVERDFSPAWLPRGLACCLAMVPAGMDAETLYAAQSVLGACFPDPGEVSRTQVDAALARLSGFLVYEGTGSARRWRLRNESLAEACLRRFGNPGLIEDLNHALLPFGAIPFVERWSDEGCENWVGLATERAAAFERLTWEQRNAVVQRLSARIGAGLLPAAAHRDLGLGRQQAVLAFEAGDEARFDAEAAAIFQALQVRLAEPLSDAVRADLLFDLAGTAVALHVVAFRRDAAEDAELTGTAVRAYAESAALCPERWTPLRRVRAIMLHYNTAYMRAQVGPSAAAHAALDAAMEAGAGLDPEMVEARLQLGDCHRLRAQLFDGEGQRQAAIEACGQSINHYRAVIGVLPEHRDRLADMYGRRASNLFAQEWYEEAIEDNTAGIALFHALDQNRPEVRESLASLYSARAGCAARLERWTAAVSDYRVILELLGSLEPTQARQLFSGRAQQRMAHWLHKAGEPEQADEAYAQAVAILGPLSASNTVARSSLAECYRERAAMARERGLPEQWLAAYAGAPETMLLGDNEFGVLLHSAGEPEPGAGRSPRVTEDASFLQFQPLADAWVEWAREGVGLAGPQFVGLREHVRFRVAPLPFYKDGHLLVVEDVRRNGAGEMFALCRLGKEVSGMDWTNRAIYEANDRWGIHLDEPAQLLTYCRFFFCFVYGRFGRFQVFDNVRELPWLDTATEADRDRVRAVSSPLAVLPSSGPEAYQVDARILFKDAVFSSTLHVRRASDASSRAGYVELSDEAMLLEAVPMRLLPSPHLRDRQEADMAQVDENVDHRVRESPLLRYEDAPERTLLHQAQIGVLLHTLREEAPGQEPLSRISDDAGFLVFEPLPDGLTVWAHEQLGMNGVEFARVRERVSFRVAPLAFYDESYVLVAEDTSRRGRREAFALCRLGREVIGLDWSDEPIYHEANARWGVLLDTPEQVLQYCRFFFHFERRGGYQIFDDAGDLPWMEGATDEDRARVAAVCAPAQLVSSPQDGIHRLLARMVLGDSIYSATVLVHQGLDKRGERGHVSVTELTQILAGLPLRVPPPPFLRDADGGPPEAEEPSPEPGAAEGMENA